MRMGVFLGRTAVRRPARVAQSIHAVNRIVDDRVLELAKLAGRASQFQVALIVHHGDSRGVIAAILQAAKAVDDERDNFLRTDISDDAAHGWSPSEDDASEPAGAGRTLRLAQAFEERGEHLAKACAYRK